MSHNDNSATLWAVWDWPTYTNIKTGCNSTSVGDQYYYNNIGYIKMADGNCWTQSLQGMASWSNALSFCQSGTSFATPDQWSNLIYSVSGSTSKKNGYYSEDTGTLLRAFNWSTSYNLAIWTSYRNGSGGAAVAYVNSSGSDVGSIVYQGITTVHTVCIVN